MSHQVSAVSAVRFFPEVKSLNTKKKKPRSTHVVVCKNIRTFGLKWTLYLLAHIKTVRKGRMEKRTKTTGEILRQKGDDQCRDTCGKIFITPNLIVIIIKKQINKKTQPSNKTLCNDGNVLNLSCPRWQPLATCDS